MAPSTAGEAAVDRLYQLPLDEFVAARDDLARQARGEEGRRVRALAKPNIAAWALNQVYWSARPVFEQLLEAAGRLREAQAETLRGRRADLRSADAAHRDALRTALAESARVLEAAGHSVTPDTLRSLTAAFEALPWSEPPGRLVRPPAPAGFGAFAGMPLGLDPQDATGPARAAPDVTPSSRRPERKRSRGEEKDEAAARKAAAQRELAERQRQAREAADDARRAAAAAAERQQAASDGVVRAREEEQSARMRLEEARRRLQEAENAHPAARREAASADAAAREAHAAAARLERPTRPVR